MVRPLPHLKLRQEGVAILMVLMTITVLTAIMGDFIFDTQINKLKSYNVQDRAQARLNAEAGLRLAMVRLRLFKEGGNMISGNSQAGQMVSQQLLNQIWEIPFVYPMPIMPEMNARQKSAIEDFSETVLLDGELNVVIENISSRLNLNTLRWSAFQQTPAAATPPPTNPPANGDEPPGEPPPPNEDAEAKAIREKLEKFNAFEEQLFSLIRLAIEARREDIAFYDRYGNLDPKMLISSLKYYISDPELPYEDDFRAQMESNYQAEGITPKYGALTSMSELHNVIGWDDEIIDLIRNDITVHGSIILDLNRITDKMLRLILPDVDDQQIKIYFDTKNNPENPLFFNSPEDFKTFVSDTINIASDETVSEGIDRLLKAGITFESSPTLFRVVSTGKFNRATYALTAFVTIPDPPPTPQATPNPTPNPNQPPKAEEKPPANNNNTGGNQNTKKPRLEPRIVELYVEG